jgi:hypothetical protein
MSNNIVLCELSECPICMVEIVGSTNRVTTECGHEFHTKCLLSNIAYNGFGCPYCRSEMVEESVANHLHEDDDDDDNDGDDEDEDEDDDGNDDEIEESDILRGMRFMLQRVTGEILTNEDDTQDEDDYENELLATPKPKPSIDLIIKKLFENGVTNKTLVTALLFADHPEYNDSDEDHLQLHEVREYIYDLIRNILNNYTIEQEEELEVEEHIDNHDDDDSAHEIENNNNDSNNKYDFYFLQNEFIDNCKQNHNFSFILEETILPIF